MTKDEINDLVMKFLVEEKGFNIKEKCLMGDTTLHRAILRGNYDMVKFLVEHGADINATDDNRISWPGRTPLTLSIMKDQIFWPMKQMPDSKITIYLREQGAKE